MMDLAISPRSWGQELPQSQKTSKFFNMNWTENALYRSRRGRLRKANPTLPRRGGYAARARGRTAEQRNAAKLSRPSSALSQRSRGSHRSRSSPVSEDPREARQRIVEELRKKFTRPDPAPQKLEDYGFVRVNQLLAQGIFDGKKVTLPKAKSEMTSPKPKDDEETRKQLI